jgi:hypothetical protein
MLTEDTTRVMNRLKAVFRSQAVAYWGKKLYARRHRDGYLAELSTGGLRRRAECLYQELDALQQLRRVTKRELVVECRKHAAAKWLQSVPFLGPVRAVSIKSRDARLSVRGSVLPVCAKCARALTNFYSAPLRSEGGTRVRVPRPPPELKSATLAHSVYSKLTRLHYIRTASRPVGFYDKAAPEPEQTIFSGRTNLLAS